MQLADREKVIIVQTVEEITYKDALTGLKTGPTCTAALEELTRQMEAGERDFAIAFMDLNGMHRINETYGKEKGDEYLKASGVLICYTFKHSPVYRCGGDEFIAILKGADYEEREKRMDYMRREMANMQMAPVEWKRLSIAAGITVCGPEDRTSLDVLDRARAGMLEEKQGESL